jgi:ribonucleoside-diphosphate reductase alpha chain
MLAAAQPFLSGAISKTTNLPESSTVDDIKKLFMESWKLGVKSITVYRDNCKGVQPLNTKQDNKLSDINSTPARKKMNTTRLSVTHRFEVAGFSGYFTVGLFDNLKPGELFIVAAKEGSTVSGLLDAFATSVSYNLQYGVPIETLVRKFRQIKFEPSGISSDLGMVTSIIDYIFKWFEEKFLDSEGTARKTLDNFGINNCCNGDAAKKLKSEIKDTKRRNEYDGPLCDECGHITQRDGTNCWVCMNCGIKHGCG